MPNFGEFLYGASVYGVAGGAEVPPDVTTGRVPWIFMDWSTTNVYEMAVNPLDATMPSVQKNITTKPTVAGRQVVIEGRPPVQTMSFSGTILTENQYNIMRVWFLEQKQIQITDDLNRKYWVYLTGFSPTRNYSHDYPWRHEYQANATVLDWGST